MTGYGQARWQGEGCTIRVEVRTVNGRSLRIRSRLPAEFMAAEQDLEKAVRGRVKRGSVELRVEVELLGARAARPVNRDALTSYVRQLEAAAEQLGRELSFHGDALLDLPGVLDSEEIPDAERAGLLAPLHATLDRALDALDQMRATEGAHLRQDLLGYCDTLGGQMAQIETGQPHTLKQYAERLRDRVNRLLEDTDIVVGEQELAREVAIFAERSSVCEKLARLRSHVVQFRPALDRAEPVGRRLEFLAQEMQREANTMSAKVADAQLSHVVVELRGTVDKIREQVQNIE